MIDDAALDEIMDTIIRPTLKAMAEMGAPFSGVLYAGLMLTSEGPKLLEYNVRFGDPECQVLMMRLKDDALLLMRAAADGQLGTMSVRWYDETALTVVMATRGYPGAYDKGSVITGLDLASEVDGIEIFHAGTALKDGKIIANGGRVLGVTALASSVRAAQATTYAAIDRIDWPQGYCRRDIGWRAIEREEGSA